MNVIIESTINILNVDLAVCATIEASYIDSGIGSYECHGARGVHHAWGWEVNNVDGLEMQEDLKEACERYFHEIEFPKSNHRRYLKALRLKIKKVLYAYYALDVPNLFSDDKLEAVTSRIPMSDDTWDNNCQ